ncbi:MAG: hypothetical protein WAV18_03005 [Roseiarcus sp.]
MGIAHALDFFGTAACGRFETVIISTVVRMSKIVPAAAIGLPNSSGFRARARQALPVHRQPDRRPDVLGPALEGFSPTPEFPQIAEAKALFESHAHL